LKRIWLIGGTGESVILAQAIAHARLPCVVSVTTQSAAALYVIVPTIQVRVGKLDSKELSSFLTKYNIGVVLDASHPFAVDISKNAISAVRDLRGVNSQTLAYLRFERPALESEKTSDETTVWFVDTVENLLETDWLQGQRVLLTIGYRFLSLFKAWQARATLFTRILPSPVALEAALESGFSSDRIIALRPPIGFELERSLWQQWQIATVVTKASGTPGGEDIKRKLAAQLGVRLIIIDRPVIAYPQQTSDVEQALQFCRQFL
jgi:precorrin-6A/cobalt-precorrin-6A reductase